MTTGNGKQLGNPFSTGGGGVNFEVHVQTLFAVLMLAGGFPPCLPCRPIKQIKLQGGWAGFHTDDCIVVTGHFDGSDERKLFAQIKRSITITKINATFGQVIRAMWRDFIDTASFTQKKDVLALVTGTLSAGDIGDTRAILDWARHANSAAEFLTKVKATNVSSNTKREKLEAFRFHLNQAADRSVLDEELFQFLRHFHLLGYDLDFRGGVMHAMLHSIIGHYAPENAADIWARVLQEVMSFNQSAGTLTPSSFPDDLRAVFSRPAPATMPDAISSTIPPSHARTWTSPEFAAALVTASLLGSWNEQSSADRAIIDSLTQGKVGEWYETIRDVLQLPDSPLSQKGGIWKIKNRGELWETLGSRVFDEHLKAVRTGAVRILSERDPQFSLAPDERFMARVRGKVLAHSSQIRAGLTDTLALLGSQPEALTNCSPGAATSTAALATRAVLKEADWVLWGSLNDLLPLIAEAAPGELLDAVEGALTATPCPFDNLFAQEGAGVGGRIYLTGLLWALETLAWDDQYIVRSVVALGALADRDPGGSWGNRPSGSLTSIFLPWFPQTTAVASKRLVAIETLLREHPRAGWELLLHLLPSEGGVSMGTRKPAWQRTIPQGEIARPTVKEYWDQVGNYAALAADTAAADPSRLQQLAANIDRLPSTAATKVLEYISSSAITSQPEPERLELWEALTNLARKHRRFPDAKWVLPAGRIAEIESTALRVAPKKPELVHRGLFSGQDRDLYEENDNWQNQEERLNTRRREAVSEILAASGLDAIVAFAEAVGSPGSVGFTLGALGQSEAVPSVVPWLLLSQDQKKQAFARGFVLGYFQRAKWAWVDQLDTSKWTDEEIAALFIALPFELSTWERAERLLGGKAGLYWNAALVKPYQAEGAIAAAVDALLKHGRPRAAIDCLAVAAHQGQSVDKERSVRALFEALRSGEPIGAMHIYQVVAIIQSLQKDPAANQDDLLKIEWAYLPILAEQNGASPKTLERRMGSEPSLFCEIISTVFRSTDKAKSDLESTPEQQALADNAFRLLHNWRTPPGTATDGTFSGGDFVRWIDAVRALCEKSGHLTVAMQQAGEVLISCPADPDGLWLHRSVAEVLNRQDMAELRRGYEIGIVNSRGVHYVDPSGEPEKELSRKYKGLAEEIENAGFHRLAGSLREVAETYQLDAKRVIAESESEATEG